MPVVHQAVVTVQIKAEAAAAAAAVAPFSRCGQMRSLQVLQPLHLLSLPLGVTEVMEAQTLWATSEAAVVVVEVVVDIFLSTTSLAQALQLQTVLMLVAARVVTVPTVLVRASEGLAVLVVPAVELDFIKQLIKHLQAILVLLVPLVVPLQALLAVLVVLED